MMIIDPPITSVSPEEKILAWLAELAEMPQDDKTVVDETKWATDCLAWSRARSASALPRDPDEGNGEGQKSP